MLATNLRDAFVFQSTPVRVDGRDSVPMTLFLTHRLFQSTPVRVDGRDSNIPPPIDSMSHDSFNPLPSGWTGETY